MNLEGIEKTRLFQGMTAKELSRMKDEGLTQFQSLIETLHLQWHK